MVKLKEEKIFGIGLPKTGNTSLFWFLKNRGLTGYQAPTIDQWNDLDSVDFCLDTPCNLFFYDLYKRYPKAKFILTHRNDDDWLESWKKHKLLTLPKSKEHSRYRKEIDIFNIYPSTFIHTVKQYIPKSQLFILDMDNLDIQGLISFLNVSDSNIFFSRLNVSSS